MEQLPYPKQTLAPAPTARPTSSPQSLVPFARSPMRFQISHYMPFIKLDSTRLVSGEVLGRDAI
jgi:hypothetical protein